MTKQELAAKTAAALEALYPDAVCSLEYEDEPWKLLILARLSAQCTDARVNIVAKTLFWRFPTPESVADCDLAALEETIRPCGLYKTKAKSIRETAGILVRDYGGRVPDTMDELLALPGVGRKTANVMLSVIFHQAAMAVDTHVFRVSHRIGLVPPSCTTPLSVERMLTRHFAPEVLHDANHWLILHGRYVCTAQKPKCQLCGLHDICQGKLV